ncbi:MAG: histidine kinase dimerization/phospho-acceptor domain-containing protein [Planctomycetota bacterium]|nr:histidine kinase dimerization/phospho-acceptor domain-containing protein [Planctomycetota bacterium]
MKERTTALVDPAGRLRSASSLLRSLQVHEYNAIESLLERHSQPEEILCVVIDGDFADIEKTGRLIDRDGLPPLLLVAVNNAEEGAHWIENGAMDFVVLPGRRDELDSRIQAMVQWKSTLLDPSHQELCHRKTLRTLAHDLKNPLNAVFCYAELLLMDEGLAPAVRRDIQHIITNANVLLETLDSRVNFQQEETESQPAGDELS